MDKKNDAEQASKNLSYPSYFSILELDSKVEIEYNMSEMDVQYMRQSGTEWPVNPQSRAISAVRPLAGHFSYKG